MQNKIDRIKQIAASIQTQADEVLLDIDDSQVDSLLHLFLMLHNAIGQIKEASKQLKEAKNP